MRVLFDNVNLSSDNGPNSFAKKLVHALHEQGHEVSDKAPQGSGDIVLSFIETFVNHEKPLVQRLDGIYFNNQFDYMHQNRNILNTYEKADGVIFQTSFNKDLITKYFGEHKNSIVIRNGAQIELLELVPLLDSFNIDSTGEKISFSEIEGNVWCCASNWRPHKRLWDNIKYYIENREENDVLIVAGRTKDNVAKAWGNHSRFHDKVLKREKIYFAQNMNYSTLLQLYKTSDKFIHLAWLDHCPNVVVDARAMGCQIICSDSGGTKEVAGDNAILIQEQNEWDFKPVKLYDPPALNFDKKIDNIYTQGSNDIRDVAKEYIEFFVRTLEKTR